MSRFTDWTFRLRALLGRRSLESQVDQEFAFHVQMEAEKLQRDGWSADGRPLPQGGHQHQREDRRRTKAPELLR